MIKALFFDLDGTLLNSQKKIEDSAREALMACKAKGIRIYVATARPPLLRKMLNLRDDENELLADGGVYYNGGLVMFHGERRYFPVSRDVFMKTLKIASAHDHINFAVQMAGEKHSFLKDLAIDQYDMWGIDKSFILPFSYPWEHAMVKLLIYRWESSIEEVYQQLYPLIGSQANVYLTGRGTSIEIISPAINKKAAIDQIVEQMHFKMDEVVVFGDDHNDMEMLKGYSQSVAMGNAHDSIKACASHVTRSNDEDGIAYALKHYLHVL